MTFLPGRFDVRRFWLSTLTVGLLVGGLFVVTGQPHADADVIGDCLAGEYFDGVDTCLPCPAGEYQPLAAQASCSPADPGHFASGTGNTAQTACSPGTFQGGSGATGCNGAGPGHFAAGFGNAAQTACAPGTYEPSSGSAGCRDSGRGYFVVGAGSTARRGCGPGLYQPSARSAF
ncbi:MAG: hypothetical protein V3W36_05280, partial [Acidimicrobiia bacterium]